MSDPIRCWFIYLAVGRNESNSSTFSLSWLSCNIGTHDVERSRLRIPASRSLIKIHFSKPHRNYIYSRRHTNGQINNRSRASVCKLNGSPNMWECAALWDFGLLLNLSKPNLSVVYCTMYLLVNCLSCVFLRDFVTHLRTRVLTTFVPFIGKTPSHSNRWYVVKFRT